MGKRLNKPNSEDSPDGSLMEGRTVPASLPQVAHCLAARIAYRVFSAAHRTVQGT
jgi:hypothetical protein